MLMKTEAMINVIRYDYINKKPVLTYEQLMQLRKELKEEKALNLYIKRYKSNKSILKRFTKQ